MLKKLLKYDLKWIYKLLIVFYILSLATASLSRIFGLFDNSFICVIISKILSGATITFIINIIINNLIRCWARFIRNIYKDESYLTHTLPVSKREIYLSKVISAIITLFTSFLVVIITLIISYYSKESIEMLKQVLNTITDMGINKYLFVVMMLLIIYIEFLFIVVLGYISIILGHRSNNKKMLKSIIFGFVLYFALSTVTLLVLFTIALFNKDVMNIFNTVNAPTPSTGKFLIIFSTTIYMIYTIIYYILGKYLLEKGVNVD